MNSGLDCMPHRRHKRLLEDGIVWRSVSTGVLVGEKEQFIHPNMLIYARTRRATKYDQLKRLDRLTS